MILVLSFIKLSKFSTSFTSKNVVSILNLLSQLARNSYVGLYKDLTANMWSPDLIKARIEEVMALTPAAKALADSHFSSFAIFYSKISIVGLLSLV